MPRSTCRRLAEHEGVSLAAGRAAAHWNVIDDFADGVSRADLRRARILAFVSHTGQVARTVVVENALWSTACVRISGVIGKTGADSVVASGVRTAGQRGAGVVFHGRRG